MELLRASDTRNLTPVLDWNIEEADPEKGSVTSRLTKECVAVFRRLLKKLSQEEVPPREILRRLERSCSSLVLWESGYGVADGGLDEALSKSRTLRRSTLEYLLNIGRALSHRLPPFIDGGDEKLGSHGAALRSVVAEAETSMHEGYQDGSDGDDSDSDGSSVSLPSDWDEVAEDLQTDVQCLLDLGPLIRSPAADPLQLSREGKRIPEKWNPHAFYGDSIRVRFPKAEPALVDRLARANLERFLKGRADRERNQGAGDTEVVAGPAETIAPHTEPVSKFHDSGLGTSINTGSAYAETVMSYHRKDGESVRIPPLPEEARKGSPFECVACGKNVMMKTTSAWKKHLFRDLCPWICHDLQCNFGLFQSREDWVQHLGLQHELDPEWKSFACPMCEEDTGDGKFSITRHLSSHMEEISLKALPGGVEPDEFSDSGTDDSSTTDAVDLAEEERSKTSGFGADRRPSLSPQLGPDDFLVPSDGAASLHDFTNAEEEYPYRTKCICDNPGGDGDSILCETCETWQHIECFYPDNQEEALREDFSHSCHECNPRVLDRGNPSNTKAIKARYPRDHQPRGISPSPSVLYPPMSHPGRSHDDSEGEAGSQTSVLTAASRAPLPDPDGKLGGFPPPLAGGSLTKWDVYKERIIKLYKTEGMTLELVREIMRRDFDFNAGIRTYRIYLKKWNVRKRKTTHWEKSPPPSSWGFSPLGRPLASQLPEQQQEQQQQQHSTIGRMTQIPGVNIWLQGVDDLRPHTIVDTEIRRSTKRWEGGETLNNSDPDEGETPKTVVQPTAWVIGSDTSIDRPPIKATRKPVFERSDAKIRSEEGDTDNIPSLMLPPQVLPRDGDKGSIVPKAINQHASTYDHSSGAPSVVSPPAEAPMSKRAHGNDQILDPSIYSLEKDAHLEGSYICQACVPPKGFTEKEDLYHHRVRKHDKIFPYECPEPECSRSFLDQGDLDRHLERMHFLKKSTRTGEAAPKVAGDAGDADTQRMPTVDDGDLPDSQAGQGNGQGQNLVAQEVNGMIYYYDASQLPAMETLPGHVMDLRGVGAWNGGSRV